MSRSPAIKNKSYHHEVVESYVLNPGDLILFDLIDGKGKQLGLIASIHASKTDCFNTRTMITVDNPMYDYSFDESISVKKVGMLTLKLEDREEIIYTDHDDERWDEFQILSKCSLIDGGLPSSYSITLSSSSNMADTILIHPFIRSHVQAKKEVIMRNEVTFFNQLNAVSSTDDDSDFEIKLGGGMY